MKKSVVEFKSETECFIYKNVFLLLRDKNKRIKVSLIDKAAEVAVKHYRTGGNFKGKAFDACLDIGKKELKILIGAGA